MRDDFLYGISTSSYHIEGGNTHADWHTFEQQIFAESPDDRNGQGVDYWNRWRDDHTYLDDLGVNAFRTSVEWSRLQPTGPDSFDEEAFDRYREIFADLKRRNIAIVLTLYHYVQPQWFQTLGGFEFENNLIYFERFATKVLDELGEYISVITPINEIMVYSSLGYLFGHFPPQGNSLWRSIRTTRNLIKAHFFVARVLAQKDLPIRIGTSEQYRHFIAKKGDVAAWGAAKALDYLFNTAVTQSIATNRFAPPFGRYETIERHAFKPLDFVGLQCYGELSIRVVRKGSTFAIQPEHGDDWLENVYQHPLDQNAFTRAVKHLHRFNIPIVVTEIGASSTNELEQSNRVQEYMDTVHTLKHDGLSGFLYFTLFDCFEWTSGYQHHFGLIGIDRQDNLRRIIKPAFNTYKEQIARLRGR